jgi:folate-binding protein YgfZ
MKRGPFYQLQAEAGATFVGSDGWELPAAYHSPADELVALKNAVGLVDLTGWGLLRLQGRDRLDFVQRLSTNDVGSLTPGQGAPTVFTTPIGRIVDLAFLSVCEDDLLLLVGRGADEVVAGWLRRHIFFNDQVRVENVTEGWGLMALCGPQAATLLGELFGQEPEGDQLTPFHARTAQRQGLDLTLMRSVPFDQAFLLLTPADPAVTLWALLVSALPSVGGALVGETALETLRVGAGWPRFGRELSEDYIPLEAGLKGAISFNKGCYVGQEVIARLETYQRLAKRLVVLGCAGESGPADEVLAPGNTVRAEGVKVGQVTSVAPLADQGLVKALAYVKAGMAEPGGELCVVGEEGELSARVLAVPGASQK